MKIKNVTAWVRLIKWLIIIACFGHMVYLTCGVFYDWLGANPVETLTHVTGEWGLRLLWLTLAITPLRRLFHLNSLGRFRRLLGVLSFVYISAHLGIYIVFDHFFDGWSIVDDVIERPYIAVGVAAYILMIPLAITSLNYWQKRLGKTWLLLHRMVYLIAILGVVHYWWLVKADVLEPAVYAVILLFLLGVRVWFLVRKKRKSPDHGVAN